ncbi:MAG TPA: YceI family protein [Gemmatimonadaceae bacterium]|nr:YceI family protein [Gemmatimonadaceae bacterium]
MNWNIDTAHSHVDFSVKHLGIATVRGRFRTFGGSARTDANGALVGFSADIDAASIETGVDQRDAHLRSADFFDTEHHPNMHFESTAITPLGGRQYRADGTLSMRGETKPVTLDIELTDAVKDPWGNTKIGATATGKIRRSEWGLTWNQVLEVGGLMVSDDVKIALEVEGSGSSNNNN